VALPGAVESLPQRARRVLKVDLNCSEAAPRRPLKSGTFDCQLLARLVRLSPVAADLGARR
jgi:hypothetical protein